MVLAADGSATWTSPTGKTHVTQPGSRALLPEWDIATAQLPPPPTSPGAMRGQMMPIRKQTRAADRKTRIDAERRHNTTDPPF